MRGCFTAPTADAQVAPIGGGRLHYDRRRLAQVASLGEVFRHVTPASLPAVANYRITEMLAEATAILDCRNPADVGLTVNDLSDDLDYARIDDTPSRRLAEAAVSVGAEGLLVPSATNLGDNLILFPKNRRKGSMLTGISSVDPRLYVDRAGLT
jgi:hypothetical protein